MSKGKKTAPAIYAVPRELIEEFDGLTAKQIKKMPMSEFARRTRREPVRYIPEPPPEATASTASDPLLSEYISATGNSGSQITMEDLQGMSLAEYQQVRGQLGIGGSEYGRGILDQHGSWQEAAARKAGRSAMVTSNVTESPKLTGRYLNHEDGLDRRPVAQRFGSAANAWQVDQ